MSGCYTLMECLITPKSPANTALLQCESKWVVNFKFSGHMSYFVDTMVLNKVIKLSYIKAVIL